MDRKFAQVSPALWLAPMQAQALASGRSAAMLPHRGGDAERRARACSDRFSSLTCHWDGLPDRAMVPRGLEPRTLRFLAVRSNQLSYETL